MGSTKQFNRLDLPLYQTINVGGINIDARRHRGPLKYRPGVF
jgi:hypothetical protein